MRNSVDASTIWFDIKNGWHSGNISNIFNLSQVLITGAL